MLGAIDGPPRTLSDSAATLLYFEGTDYALNRVSRSCTTATDENTGITTQTCDEVWNEYITVRLDESSFDETAVSLVDWLIPDDEAHLFAEIAAGSIGLSGILTLAKKSGKKAALKVAGRSVIGGVAGAYAIWVYYDATAPYAEINGIDNCVFEPPENRGDDIKKWTAVEVSASSTETNGKVKSVRNSVVHYCKETE